jgi:hypothetical protein
MLIEETSWALVQSNSSSIKDNYWCEPCSACLVVESMSSLARRLSYLKIQCCHKRIVYSFYNNNYK